MARERRLMFGEVAELYDQTRPSYPAALVDDVLEAAGVQTTDEVLEVGAGTGKATVLFGSRGVRVLALEPDVGMAAIARRNCDAYPEVRIVQSDFEHWHGDSAGFSLIYSAQAWHWVTEAVRYTRARDALRSGGTLAVFWNFPDWDATELRDELRDAYRRVGLESVLDGPMNPTKISRYDRSADWDREIAAAPGFELPEVRGYRWEHDYSSAEYTRMLRTHSDHLMLAGDRRDALLEAVAGVLDANGGKLSINYVTRLCLAKATAG